MLKNLNATLHAVLRYKYKIFVHFYFIIHAPKRRIQRRQVRRNSGCRSLYIYIYNYMCIYYIVHPAQTAMNRKMKELNTTGVKVSTDRKRLNAVRITTIIIIVIVRRKNNYGKEDKRHRRSGRWRSFGPD